MGYTRTNYRVTGKQLSPDAFGGALDNYIEGSGVRTNWYGGFIMGSWAFDRPPTTSGVVPISAYGAICAYYGETWISNTIGRDGGHSGFKVMPIAAIATYQGTACCMYWAKPAFSYSGSIAFVSVLRGSTNSSPTGVASAASIGFYWYGWIVSTPWT